MSEVRLGSITGGHGIKGWIKVFSHTDPIDAILNYPNWTLRRSGESQQMSIEEGRINGKKLIARVDGIDTRETADSFGGFEIYVDREELPQLDDGAFYWLQLHGLKVLNNQGVVFGQVDHLLQTGANDVLVVHPTEDSIDDQERLIPYVEDKVIQKVEISVGEIVIDWEVDY